MTTIVYRDGVLAADRLVTKGDISVGQMCKITKVIDSHGDLLGWVACTGWPSDIVDAAKWLSKWPEVGNAPKRFLDGESAGLFLMKSGEVWNLCGTAPFQTEADFQASGSGFEVATGALAMGATAEKAVEIASAHDQSTGAGVDSVRAA